MAGQRVVIDALGLPPFGGTRKLVTRLLAQVATYDKRNHYLVYLSKTEPELLARENFELRIVPIKNRMLLRLWAQVYFPLQLRRQSADIFHAMKNQGVLGVSCRYLLSIFDLTHVKLSHFYPRIDSLYWRFGLPLILRGVDGVMTISNTVSQELSEMYHFPQCKIRLIYPGVSPEYFTKGNHAARTSICAKYHLPNKIILYVGGLGIHKNLSTIIKALGMIRSKIPHSLVIVGGAHHTSSDLTLPHLVEQLNLSSRVRFLESISDDELCSIYMASDLFVLPSLNEGFGLAMVEAMASGLPIMASRVGAIPEVCGDAVWLVDDPLSIDEWADGMRILLSDAGELHQLRQRSVARASYFSWGRAAIDLVDWYQSTY